MFVRMCLRSHLNMLPRDSEMQSQNSRHQVCGLPDPGVGDQVMWARLEWKRKKLWIHIVSEPKIDLSFEPPCRSLIFFRRKPKPIQTTPIFSCAFAFLRCFVYVIVLSWPYLSVFLWLMQSEPVNIKCSGGLGSSRCEKKEKGKRRRRRKNKFKRSSFSWSNWLSSKQAKRGRAKVEQTKKKERQKCHWKIVILKLSKCLLN